MTLLDIYFVLCAISFVLGMIAFIESLDSSATGEFYDIVLALIVGVLAAILCPITIFLAVTVLLGGLRKAHSRRRWKKRYNANKTVST